MTNMHETMITCPKCSHALMAVTIQHNKVIQPDESYIILRCVNCHNRLQFVVDLTPSFDRTDVACASV